MFRLFFNCVTCLLLNFVVISSAVAKTPNIVLILADDLGFTDTEPYGGEIETPNISRLADEGVLFTNYHTAASCAPTRGMLLTGVDSHRNGVPNIPEAIPPEQAKHENYRGTLNHNVVTIATLLRDAGYHTYLTGKWHLGKTKDLLPSQRGFERTVAMADTGADNWEKKPYLPIYKKSNWFADGKEMDLPDDFYSSEYFIDKTIEFIDSNIKDQKPFFSYIPFLAVHIPVQAPREFTDKYMGNYDEGWEKLRKKRLERARAKKIVPDGTEMVTMATTVDWESLSEDEKAYESKKMAVYAGMVDAMDYHIGRLITYLKKIGQYDNTVFVFTSDNGAEASDAFDQPALNIQYLKLWQKLNGYNMDYETLGTRGSYINMGPSFASAAASPLAEYKFYSGEGGMRVPLIISGQGIAEKGTFTNAFTYVTDIPATLLELSGVTQPRGKYQDRRVEPMIGKSLLPLTNGDATRVYGEDEVVGYELAGNAALFQGDYKIVMSRGPVGDGQWRLFNIVTDPGETADLKEKMPEKFTALMAAYGRYAADNNVLPIPENYSHVKQVTIYSTKEQLKVLAPYVCAGILILAGFVVVRRRKKPPYSSRKVGLEFIESAPVRFVNEVTIHASCDEVFEALKDPDSWPRWFSDIQRVEWTSPPPFGVGSTRTVTLKGMTVYEKFMVWEPGKRFAFYAPKISKPIAHAFCEDYRLEDSGSGTTRLIFTVAMEPRLMLRLAGPVGRFMMGRTFKNSARSLAAYMEDNQ